jgi:hypothetical protein
VEPGVLAPTPVAVAARALGDLTPRVLEATVAPADVAELRLGMTSFDHAPSLPLLRELAIRLNVGERERSTSYAIYLPPNHQPNTPYDIPITLE